MTQFKNQHFSFNRILLVAVGLWPYEQSKCSRFRFFLFSSILIAAMVFQLTVFLTSSCTPDFILEILSTVFVYGIFLVKYISLGIDIESVRELLTQLAHIYNELKDKNEIAITDKYSCNAKRFTIALTIIAVASMCLFFLALMWSDILNVILKMNISQARHLPIITEYFIDQEKYFYLILLHISTAFCIGMTVTLAIGSMLVTFYHHVCGIFSIASYRIGHSIKFNTRNEALICERIFYAVDIHRRAMKLSIYMVSRFEIMYSFILIFGVLSLSLNLFRICKIASLRINLVEMMLPLFIIAAIILYMFVANYLGQDLTDHCKDTFINAYNIDWYMASLRVQKLILFLLQKGSTDFKVNIGGLFIPSLEAFAMLMKASMSYFTVIYSTR
ncbi:hypothetical protein HN011_004535 [Eciton burchellii]|nr:hypothetical protein HN011_004535 [Eciton burchellii]